MAPGKIKDRRVWAAILGLTLSAAGLALAESGAERSPAVYPPQKLPVKFDHALHLKNGLDCAACHDGARKSTNAGDWNLPKHPECEDCHDIEAASQGKKVDPPADCAYCHPGFDSTAQQKPARLELPTANLRFNHKVHVDKKVDCQVCHQGVSNVAVATRTQLPKMATCLTCHDGRQAAAECKTCHLTQPSGKLQMDFASGLLRPMQGNPLGLDHGPRFEFNHASRAKVSRETCDVCHAESYCAGCHNATQKPLSVHPNDYIALHPVQARADSPHCASCHRMQSFCAACHQRVGISTESDPSLLARTGQVHPDYAAWVLNPGPQHHSIAASRNINQCIACHREETCISCHAEASLGGGRGFVIDPHPAGFRTMCKSLAAKNDRPCLKCHQETRLVALGCR